MWTLGFFFGYLFECGIDFWAYYGSSQKYEVANCVMTTVLNNAFAISDALTDLIIITMPIPFVIKLQMTTSRKFAVLGIFLLGGLALAMSIMRMAIYIQSNAVLFSGHVDVDMLTSGSIYWSTLESGIGLIAACLPVVYCLLVTSGLESMIASIRSTISLRSISPRNSANKSIDSPTGSKVSKGSEKDAASQLNKKGSLNADSQASHIDLIATVPDSSHAATRREQHEMQNIGMAHGGNDNQNGYNNVDDAAKKKVEEV